MHGDFAKCNDFISQNGTRQRRYYAILCVQGTLRKGKVHGNRKTFCSQESVPCVDCRRNRPVVCGGCCGGRYRVAVRLLDGVLEPRHDSTCRGNFHDCPVCDPRRRFRANGRLFRCVRHGCGAFRFARPHMAAMRRGFLRFHEAEGRDIPFQIATTRSADT